MEGILIFKIFTAVVLWTIQNGNSVHMEGLKNIGRYNKSYREWTL